MASMNAFASSVFGTTSLTGAVQKMDTKPQLLGQLNIFEPVPSRTRTVFVDRRSQVLTLIPTSELGAPPTSFANQRRDAVPFQTVRLAKEATTYATEVEGIRSFGTETELESVQTEFLRKLAQITDDMELTWEHHRLGALQGILLDADGSTVIYNFFTEFGISQPAAVNFALTTDTTDVRQKCKDVVRAIVRGAKGGFLPSSRVHALCGDQFYDELVNHPNVEKFYLQQASTRELRDQGGAFGTFDFENITFHNYQGTDDASTVAIPTAEAKFFVEGGRDIYKVAYAPAEFEPWVNTMGRSLYALTVPDRDRGAWVKGEIYSYPLFICQRPETLQRAVAS